jgi:hypothetical protein
VHHLLETAGLIKSCGSWITTQLNWFHLGSLSCEGSYFFRHTTLGRSG